MKRLFGILPPAHFQISFIVLVATGLVQAPAASVTAPSETFSLEFQGGTFYGPGQMPDVSMPNGHISHIALDHRLNGETPYFNNKEQPPNIKSGAEAGGSNGWRSGNMSNNTPFNEYMDGGIVNVGHGALRLLNVVTRHGPNHGKQLYQLTPECNWQITTDLALDPGFAEGIMVTENLNISTGTVWTPLSVQTQMDFPGGIDAAGSLPSGVPLVGKLGDYNFDGFLDGTVVGVANIPIDHIFYPGAAVAQSRNFSSSIPISPLDAAILTIAGVLNYEEVFKKALHPEKLRPSQVDHFQENVPIYLEDIRDRIKTSLHHLNSPAIGITPEITKISEQLNEFLKKTDILTKSMKPSSVDSLDGEKIREVHELLKILFTIRNTAQKVTLFECA